MERIVSIDTPKTLNGMPLRFDYNRIAPESVPYVKSKAKEVRAFVQNRGTKVYGSEVFPIGNILIDIRRRMSQELFDIWLEVEGQIPKNTADQYALVTRKLGHKAPNLKNLTVSALHALTLPSYPQDFLDKVLSGELVPTATEILRMRILPNKSISASQCDDTTSPIMLHEIERTVASQETKEQIAGLQDQVQYLAESARCAEKALEIAEDALMEKNKEIEALEEKVQSLSGENERILGEKNFLLENYGSSSSRFTRTVILVNRLHEDVKQICYEKHSEQHEKEESCTKNEGDSTTESV